MTKKIKAIISVILLCVSIGFAQETENAPTSAITGSRLPQGALRVLPGSVPAEISNSLTKLVEAGAGRVTAGRREVLAWSGADYRKATADALISELQSTLADNGWKFEIGGTEGGITVFTVFKAGPVKRGLLGFYVPTDDALVVAWAETESAESGGSSTPGASGNFGSSMSVSHGSLTGKWDNGSVSTVTRQNTLTGSTSPGRSTRFEYSFTADGRFGFTGLAQTTNFSCTDTLYNEKAGRYSLNGSTLTLTPSKNYWKKTNSCNAVGNSERNYTLNNEVYQLSFKTDDFGNQLICLNDGKNEACYRRKV